MYASPIKTRPIKAIQRALWKHLLNSYHWLCAKCNLCCYKFMNKIIISQREPTVVLKMLKWRSATGVLRNSHVPLRLKEMFYQVIINNNMAFQIMKRYYAHKINVIEICMFHQMCDNTRRDKVRNENILSKIGIVPIEEKMRYYVLVICDLDLRMNQISRAYQLRIS